MIRPVASAALCVALLVTATGSVAAHSTTVPAATRVPATTSHQTTVGARAGSATSEQLRNVAGMRILFGHQSVGWNILEGLPAVYATAGVEGPRILETRSGLPAGPVLAHSAIGHNGDPIGKMADFAALLDQIDGAVDVALMKLCYVDIVAGTDPVKLFAAYMRTAAEIRRQHPGVRLVHVTAPLTTGDPAANALRQRYNALMRAVFGRSGELFDLAKLESTKPSGKRITGKRKGHRYYSLYHGYSSDGGHLNSQGAQRAANALLALLAAR